MLSLAFGFLTIAQGFSAAPDLTFAGAISVSPNPVVRGNDVTVSYTMTNIGNATAPQSRIRTQIKPSGSTVAIADIYQTTSSLAAGASRSKTVTTTIPANVTAGNYTVYVILDADDNIGQSDNSSASDIRSTALTIQAATTPGAPDLTFEGAISVSPNPVVRGNDVTVSYTMKNIGNAIAPDSRIRTQIKPAGSTVAIADIYQSTTSLAAGASRSKTVTTTIPANVTAGNYTVYVILDADDNIGQSDNSSASDIRSTALAVQAGTTPGTPDLTFEGAISVSPNPVVRGNDVTVSYTMKNIGNAIAPDSRIRTQIKPSGSSVAIADIYQTTTPLAAGASRSKTVTTTLPANVTAGNYTVYVILDADDNIGQSDNSSASDIRSTALTVQAGNVTGAAPTITSVTPSPIVADPGNAYQIVTLNGTNFASQPTVVLTWSQETGYTVPSSRVTFVNGNRIDISIRLGGVADNWTARVQNPDLQVSNIKPFTVSASNGTLPGSFTLGNEAPYTSSTGPALRLNWTVSATATTYDLYRNGLLYHSGLTGQTFLNSANLTVGQTYSYFVRARTASGFCDSNIIQVLIPQPSTTAPAAFTLSYDPPVWDPSSPPGPAVLLHWVQSNGASTYEVFRDGVKIYPTAGDFALLAFRNETGLNSGQTYSYYIVARNSVGSRSSNTIRVTMPPAPNETPGMFTLSNESPFWDVTANHPAVRLNWTRSFQATAYAVSRNGVKIFPAKGNFDGTTFLDSGAEPNTAVHYTIRASNALGSIESNEIQVVLPSKPLSPAGVPGAFSMTADNPSWDSATNLPTVPLFWSAADRAESYEILRNNIVIHKAGVALMHVEGDGLMPGKTYAYQVRARNSLGVSVSNKLSIQIPARPATPLPTFTLRTDPPYLQSGVNQYPAVRLVWDKVAGASNYEVFQDGLRIAAGLKANTFLRNAGLGNGATYVFRVVASGAGGEMESNEVSVVMPTPTVNAPGVFTLSNDAPSWDERPPAGPVVRLHWSAARYAASYTLLRDGMIYASGLSGTAFLNDKNLTPGGTHRFQVVAINPSGATLSKEVFVTMPDGPSASVKALPLAAGVPSSALSGRAGDRHLFVFTVPAGMSYLGVTSAAQAGNVDLYVSKGAVPKPPTTYGYRSINPGSNEQVDVTSPTAGAYYAMIVGASDYGNAKILVTVTPAASSVATPVISPGSVTSLEPITVSITCATPGAEIRYTTDGSEPAATSKLRFDSGNPPTFSAQEITIKARAFKVGMAASAVATVSYSMPARVDGQKMESFETRNISGWLGQDHLFYMDVPQDEIQPSFVRGVAAIGIKLGGEGGVIALGSLEILARKDRVPTPTEYDFRLSGRGEAVVSLSDIPKGLGGRWFFLVRNRSVRADLFALRLYYQPVVLKELTGKALVSNKATWIVSHGRVDSLASFKELGQELQYADPASQVLLVDWSGAAGVNNLRLLDAWTVLLKDQFDKGDLSGTQFIEPVARKLRQLTAAIGLDSSTMNWVGHSWGSLLGYEFTLPWQGRSSKFDRMVALDPASSGKVVSLVTGDVYKHHNLRFTDAVNGQSMAFVAVDPKGIDYGSPEKAETANDSCTVRFNDPTDDEAHSGVVAVYQRALRDWHNPNFQKRDYAWYLSPARMIEANKPWRRDSVSGRGVLGYAVTFGIIRPTIRLPNDLPTRYELAIDATLEGFGTPRQFQGINGVRFCDPSTYPKGITNP